MEFYQTGDLLYIKVKELPKDLTDTMSGVILHSDRTGHTHKVVGASATVLKGKEKDYVFAPEGARLTHEEHRDLELPPGAYELRVVQEYSHAEEEARNVID